jgi:hypothetical protein
LTVSSLIASFPFQFITIIPLKSLLAARYYCSEENNE